jgi:hypothetical protein
MHVRLTKDDLASCMAHLRRWACRRKIDGAANETNQDQRLTAAPACIRELVDALLPRCLAVTC